jgi:hypothetical protein
MNPLRFSIKTDDKEFFRELISLSMLSKDLKLKFPIQNRALSPDDLLQFANSFGIALASTGAIELFKALIKKFSDKKTSATTSVNNINIHNNYAPVFIIIQTHIEQQQGNPDHKSQTE